MADQNQVIVTPGFTAHAVQVHHREIPELCADGESPASAAVNLAQDLVRELNGVTHDRNCDLFQRAVADVQSFVKAHL